MDFISVDTEQEPANEPNHEDIERAGRISRVLRTLEPVASQALARAYGDDGARLQNAQRWQAVALDCSLAIERGRSTLSTDYGNPAARWLQHELAAPEPSADLKLVERVCKALLGHAEQEYTRESAKHRRFGQGVDISAPPTPPKLTVAQVARLIGLSRQAVHQAMSRGALPSVEFDGRIFVDLKKIKNSSADIWQQYLQGWNARNGGHGAPNCQHGLPSLLEGADVTAAKSAPRERAPVCYDRYGDSFFLTNVKPQSNALIRAQKRTHEDVEHSKR